MSVFGNGNLFASVLGWQQQQQQTSAFGNLMYQMKNVYLTSGTAGATVGFVEGPDDPFTSCPNQAWLDKRVNEMRVRL